jgi:hypothetical protein
MSNFRPISLLISFSKIFEKIIYTKIYTNVALNKILANEQYRFRSSLSIDNASYTLIHEILSAMNNKHTVGGNFVIQVQNYRPLSLLSVFSKLVEKLMYNRLM